MVAAGAPMAAVERTAITTRMAFPPTTAGTAEFFRSGDSHRLPITAFTGRSVSPQSTA